jgi:hypothetical protein
LLLLTSAYLLKGRRSVPNTHDLVADGRNRHGHEITNTLVVVNNQDLPEKARQDEAQFGAQVSERGLDLLLGPGGIGLLQGVKGEARIVVDERNFGVALRRRPDGAVQEDADRVDAQRRHQALPQRDQPLLVQGQAIGRLHRSGPPP